jgi:probable addiction module antidote protein
MSKTLSKFDAAATLNDAEAMAEYMAAAFETGDPSYISHSLGVVARAKGMTEIAKESGLSREHLYRSFSEEGNPTLKSVLAVMGALGVRISATALDNNASQAKKARPGRPVKKAAKKPPRKKAAASSQKKAPTRAKKQAAA